MRLNKAATIVLAGTFIGVAGYSAAAPSQVQAKEKVYSWSKNKTVKVKYKKNLSKQAAQTSSSSRSFSSTSSSTKSTASESKKVNPWTEEDSAALRQEILKVINDFRSQAGLPAVMLNNDSNDILDARSLGKMKFSIKKHCDVNHDGYETVEKAIEEKTNGKLSPSETLTPTGLDEYESDKKQIDEIVDKYKSDMQGEKEDYEAIYINHTRKNITNYCGTVNHYVSLINWGKTQSASQVAIGVSCYGPSGVIDSTYYENYGDGGNRVCLVIEMLYPVRS